MALVVSIFSCDVREDSRQENVSINYDSLNSILEEMYVADQVVRGNSRFSDDQSELAKRFDFDMHKVDSINQQTFLQIIETYDWPPDSLLSRDASLALFLVLQHSPQEVMEKYFPLFRANTVFSAPVAMMEDRILMRQGKKQIYGSQASSTLREDGTMAIWPIDDPENVNALRKGLFSTTVEEYAIRLGAEYDPNEQLPD